VLSLRRSFLLFPKN